eukprot:CAMPEP_0117632498 /NCGR_PEP_ID=MMETSP0802-20121206/4618_1 /TAXON_ID=38833 /ORGANISM="Micromonas sp., Strain CCMP2099" /LENGTH=117 /DNA_ID=CAMNT_0005436953 /DNA_START=1252 /DNA_END=1601 /DNA_ORIENTATION=+
MGTATIVFPFRTSSDICPAVQSTPESEASRTTASTSCSSAFRTRQLTTSLVVGISSSSTTPASTTPPSATARFNRQPRKELATRSTATGAGRVVSEHGRRRRETRARIANPPCASTA